MESRKEKEQKESPVKAVVHPIRKRKPSAKIRMRMTRDGRFVVMSLSLMAFTEDLRELLEGKRKTIKFKVLPPPLSHPQNQQ